MNAFIEFCRTSYSNKAYHHLSFEKFVKTLCPYTVGLKNNRLIVPSNDQLNGNEFCNQWVNMMCFYESKHLEQWYSFLHSVQNVKSSIFEILNAKHNLYIQQSHLPLIEYVSEPRGGTCRICTISEVIHQYNIVTMEDLAVYLYSLIVLGIFMNDFMAQEIFEIADVDAFLACRCFQGDYDFFLGKGAGKRSVFVPQVVNEYDSTPFFHAMSDINDETQLEMLINQEVQIINRSTYLDNETPQVLAMSKALEVPETYSDYLNSKDFRYQKVTPKVFETVIYGKPAARNLKWKAYQNIEYSLPKLKKKSKKLKPGTGYQPAKAYLWNNFDVVNIHANQAQLPNPNREFKEYTPFQRRPVSDERASFYVNRPVVELEEKSERDEKSSGGMDVDSPTTATRVASTPTAERTFQIGSIASDRTVSSEISDREQHIRRLNPRDFDNLTDDDNDSGRWAL